MHTKSKGVTFKTTMIDDDDNEKDKSDEELVLLGKRLKKIFNRKNSQNNGQPSHTKGHIKLRCRFLFVSNYFDHDKRASHFKINNHAYVY